MAGIRHLMAVPASAQAATSASADLAAKSAEASPSTVSAAESRMTSAGLSAGSGPADHAHDPSASSSLGISSRPDPAGRADPEVFLSREPWSVHLAKVPPSPLSVWTYAQLGQDLTGQGDPARGNLWRQLLRALELPRGSVGFWPSFLPPGEVNQQSLSVFVEGLIRIAPRTVVFFSDDSSDPSYLAMSQFGGEALQSVDSILLPSPSSLLRLGTAQIQAHVDCLRQFFFKYS